MNNVIVLITNIVSIIMIYVSIKKFKRKFNPVVIFNIAWLCIINISSLNLFGVFKPSTIVYMMSFLLIFTFNVVYIILGKNICLYIDDEMDMHISYKILKVINFICIIFILPATFKSINILLKGGFTQVRTAMSDGGLGIESQMDWLITSWIVSPVFNAILLLGITLYIFDNKNKKLIFIGLLDMIIYTITFGGRWIVLRFVLIIIFSLMLSTNIRNSILLNVKKVRKKLYFLLFLAIGTLIYITSQRGIGGILESIIIYFTGSLSYFDQHIQNSIEVTNLYGLGFFSGLLDIPLIIIQKLLAIDFVRPSEYIGSFTSATLVIGDNRLFNGFGSALLDFWIDFGILGSVINGSILAVLIMCLYKGLAKKNIRSYSVYIFALVLLVITPIKWELDLPWSWMTILFLIIFTSKKKVRLRR
ncbi:O-antigen polymerase [Clostridium perfringens]|nr:O-antigen polymerase [Clostridium perfringens]